MATEVRKNMFLYNAPAGSGKTTLIKNMIKDITKRETSAKVLCITYTNRATDELLKECFSSNVEISTIHVFISRFMKIYFSHKQVIELYLETYKEAIQQRIQNVQEKEYIQLSNAQYVERFGKLDFETVRNNITALYYNELQFNSLYWGGLSHDDLLSFTKIVFEEFPVLYKRINGKYKYVFIDEYQDTSTDVLDIFYSAVKGVTTNLYLFGDKMQQIYKNYNGEFEEKIAEFNFSRELKYNRRSSQFIVDSLNKIYNEEDLYQEPAPDKKNGGLINNKPRILITENIEDSIIKEKIQYPNSIVLYVANRKRFNSIGAGNLYGAVSQMKEYGVGTKYTTVDVLTENSKDNPDGLFEFLFALFNIKRNFEDRKYGLVIQAIKKHIMLNDNILRIEKHTDKKELYENLDRIFNFISQGCSIKELLNLLVEKEFACTDNIMPYLKNDDYVEVLDVSIDEMINLINYIENPYVSTQHGVKGEGHDTVFFVAENSSNPSVKMYCFLELMTEIDIKLSEFERSYFSIKRYIEDVQDELGMKISDLNKKLYNEKPTYFDNIVTNFIKIFSEDIYFKKIYMPLIDEYTGAQKRGVTKLKNCFNINAIYGTLMAYKLFYVGCSRAKDNLTIFLDLSKISHFKDDLINKLSEIGFDIVVYE